MYSLKINIVRLMFVLPFLLLYWAVRGDIENGFVFLKAGLFSHLISCLILGMAVLIAAEKLLAKILENKKVRKSLDGSLELVVSFYYSSVMLFFLVVFLISSASSDYSMWERGIGNVNSLLRKLSDDKIIEVQGYLSESIKIANDSNNQQIIQYTTERQRGLARLLKEIEAYRSKTPKPNHEKLQK